MIAERPSTRGSSCSPTRFRGSATGAIRRRTADTPARHPASLATAEHAHCFPGSSSLRRSSWFLATFGQSVDELVSLPKEDSDTLEILPDLLESPIGFLLRQTQQLDRLGESFVAFREFLYPLVDVHTFMVVERPSTRGSGCSPTPIRGSATGAIRRRTADIRARHPDTPWNCRIA